MRMLSRLQSLAVERIVVKAIPLLERLGLLLSRGAPVEHLGAKVDAHALAEGADDGLRPIEQVVCVDDQTTASSRARMPASARKSNSRRSSVKPASPGMKCPKPAAALSGGAVQW
jgi:hypothetical protein